MKKGSILGYDITEKNCQISYYDETEGEPVTQETFADNYQIPVALGYLEDHWIFGREAENLRRAGEGDTITDLYTRAIHRERLMIGGKKHDAVWLLAKFIKLTLEDFPEIDFITFTVPTINEDISKMMKGIGTFLGLDKEKIYVQDHKESFCYYMLYQPKELWQYESALFYCNDQKIDAYMLHKLHPVNSSGNDLVVTVDEVASAYIKEWEVLSPIMDPEQTKDADDSFTDFIRSVFEKKVVSSVYLTGEGFENNWYPNSLKVLCNGRRAFIGNNLYSKGACYTSMCLTGDRDDGLIYLDDTKLTHRISLHMWVNGAESWYPVVSWGTPWYEADGEWEVILEDTSDIEIHIESLADDALEVETVSLAGLPDRSDYSLRLKIEVMFLDEQTCKIVFSDMGFGEFFPATDFRVEKTIQLGGIHGEFNSMS